MGKKWSGSLVNRLQEGRQFNADIYIGMGVTEYMYSDREAYEVIKIIDAKHVVVRRMDAERVDNNGMSECQKYAYKSNPNGYIRNLTLTKNGWRSRINGKLDNYFSLGTMEKYYDYSF